MMKTRRNMAGAQMTETLMQQIRTGQLKPGTAIASANDLAGQYGISYVTAHRVLRKLTEHGYCTRIRGSGTFVNPPDAWKTIQAVGIPAYYQTNPFLAHMVEELTLQAAMHKIQPVVGRGEGNDRFVERLVKNNVHAMIRFPGGVWGEPLSEPTVWRLLQRWDIRTVIINDFWTDGGPFPHVRTDEAIGISNMMDHLIGLGHRRILLVTESADADRKEALRGHHEAFQRHGLPFTPALVMNLFGAWGQDQGAVIRQMMSMSTAAVILYDLYAVEIAAAFRGMGFVLGRDYSLAGFDGIHEAETAGLSTVEQPVEALASAAFSLLEQPPSPSPPKIVLPPTCIYRDSTGPAPRNRGRHTKK